MKEYKGWFGVVRAIKDFIEVRWRILVVEFQWNYNQRFIALLIEDYSGQVITEELLLAIQKKHIGNEILKKDLIITDI